MTRLINSHKGEEEGYNRLRPEVTRQIKEERGKENCYFPYKRISVQLFLQFILYFDLPFPSFSPEIPFTYFFPPFFVITREIADYSSFF